MMKSYSIDVDCANCASLMESAVCKLDGINGATVNFLTQKISLDVAEDADFSALKKTILKTCRKYEPDVEISF